MLSVYYRYVRTVGVQIKSMFNCLSHALVFFDFLWRAKLHKQETQLIACQIGLMGKQRCN